MEEILDLLIIGEHDDEDVEEAILFHILNDREGGEGNRRNMYGQFNLDLMSPAAIKSNFRFTRDHIIQLTEALRLPAQIRTRTRNVISGNKGADGLCILLRRLAYPNRLKDLESIFGLSEQSLSQIVNEVATLICDNFGHLLDNLDNILWLNREKIERYSQAIANKEAPIGNCWGFIDGTVRPICRPKINQENYYSGHKRLHCVKYQSILAPDGLIISLKGAYPGRFHDASIFRESQIYDQLQQKAVFENEQYVLYGDQGYGIRELLLVPYANAITQEQQQFNLLMSRLRVSVEWGFQKVLSEFAFVDFKKNQKLLVQDVENYYKAAVLLTNCHTCLYRSQTSYFFDVVPPTLQEYLA